jgi:DNA-binding transcriptional MerR regulator
MEHFTRRETIILTRTSPGRLAYLARTQLVVPARADGHTGRHVYYSWEQVLELRTIQHLRRQVSLQTVRKILAFLEGVGGDRALHNKHLLIADGEVAWIQSEGSPMPQIVQVAAKCDRHVGQLKLTVMPPLAALADETWSIAHRSNVIDFEHFRRKVLYPQLD